MEYTDERIVRTLTYKNDYLAITFVYKQPQCLDTERAG